jgi:hypothetical protein
MAPRNVQLVELQIEPTAQPYRALANATASVVELGANAGTGGGVGAGGDVGVGCGDTDCSGGAGDGEVDGAAAGCPTVVEQAVSTPTVAMAANLIMRCMTGQRAVAVAVTAAARRSPR